MFECRTNFWRRQLYGAEKKQTGEEKLEKYIFEFKERKDKNCSWDTKRNAITPTLFHGERLTPRRSLQYHFGDLTRDRELDVEHNKRD
jgi:hypothetical protein